jgi:hypothetical protein
MDKTILEAIGHILREERNLTDSQIESLEQKLGDSNLIPRFAIAEIEARKGAIIGYANTSFYKSSEVIKESGAVVHKHLKMLSE